MQGAQNLESTGSAFLTIGEVARKVGVRTSTLRYYEEIGLLPPPARISGSRRYDPAILQRLAIIQTAQQSGFTLAEMRTLFNDVLDSRSGANRWHELIGHKLNELDSLLQTVLRMKQLLEDIQTCDDPELAECIYLTGQKHHIGNA
jgi:MerR family transcriptional regulator, redox-sensitive transcriptional activator SoxR